jgi:hypothetical protein
VIISGLLNKRVNSSSLYLVILPIIIGAFLVSTTSEVKVVFNFLSFWRSMYKKILRTHNQKLIKIKKIIQ